MYVRLIIELVGEPVVVQTSHIKKTTKNAWVWNKSHTFNVSRRGSLIRRLKKARVTAEIWRKAQMFERDKAVAEARGTFNQLLQHCTVELPLPVFFEDESNVVPKRKKDKRVSTSNSILKVTFRANTNFGPETELKQAVTQKLKITGWPEKYDDELNPDVAVDTAAAAAIQKTVEEETVLPPTDMSSPEVSPSPQPVQRQQQQQLQQQQQQQQRQRQARSRSSSKTQKPRKAAPKKTARAPSNADAGIADDLSKWLKDPVDIQLYSSSYMALEDEVRTVLS